MRLMRLEELQSLLPSNIDAAGLVNTMNAALSVDDPMQRWRTLLKTVLSGPPTLPFSIHQLLYKKCYEGTPQPWMAYFPDPQVIQHSNAAALCMRLGIDLSRDCFASLCNFSIKDREGFWNAVLQALSIQFSNAPSAIFDVSEGVSKVKYLPNAKMNIAQSCFQQTSNSPAIRFQRESQSVISEWSYGELENYADRVANALTVCGLRQGDTAAIFMEMTAESVAIYLGLIKAGFVAVSIADSFSAEEVRTRLEISKCRVVFTQDFIYRGEKRIPLYERVIQSAYDSAFSVVLPGLVIDSHAEGTDIACELRSEADLAWNQFIAKGAGAFAAVALPAEAPINILFSSGTTGAPKAIPWNHSTPIKAACDGYLLHNIKAGECIVWPTNFGWMMAPFLVFATLINKATIGLFCGSPMSEAFCSFIANAKVDMLGLVPGITKQLRQLDCVRDGLWAGVSRYSSTGEASTPADQLWLMSQRPGYAPVIEYCGGTEIGGGYLAGTMTQAQAPSWFSTVTPSIEIATLGSDSSEGEIALVGPSLGLSNVILNQDHFKVYFADLPTGPEGKTLRRHGDRILQESGYYRAMGRADDTMNLGGIKVSSVQLENVCCLCDAVSECAAIATSPADGGPDLLVVFVVSKGAGVAQSELKIKLQAIIKERLNPLFKIHDVCLLTALPRTATGKVMRRELRARYTRNPKL